MKPENVTCPSCNGQMRSRRNAQTGQRFWGCANYPSCRGTRDTDGEASHGDRDDRDDTLPSERLRQASKSRWRYE